MTPRPTRKPKAVLEVAAPPAAPAAPAAPPPWQRYADALAALIAAEDDPAYRDLLRLTFLRARHTPWRNL
jgi:hypothetical protein